MHPRDNLFFNDDEVVADEQVATAIERALAAADNDDVLTDEEVTARLSLLFARQRHSNNRPERR